MNKDILLMINGWAGQSKLLDNVMIASAKYLIFVVFAVGLACAGYYVYKKEWKPAIYFAVSLAATFVLLELAAMLNLDHRPFMDVSTLHQLISHAAGKSFPSDHTTASTGVALSVLYFTKFKKTGVILLIAALLIGFSRIFVGVHYPLDILGGIVTAIIGTTSVYIVMRMTNRSAKNKMSFSSH